MLSLRQTGINGSHGLNMRIGFREPRPESRPIHAKLKAASHGRSSMVQYGTVLAIGASFSFGQFMRHVVPLSDLFVDVHRRRFAGGKIDNAINVIRDAHERTQHTSH